MKLTAPRATANAFVNVKDNHDTPTIEPVDNTVQELSEDFDGSEEVNCDGSAWEGSCAPTKSQRRQSRSTLLVHFNSGITDDGNDDECGNGGDGVAPTEVDEAVPAAAEDDKQEVGSSDAGGDLLVDFSSTEEDNCDENQDETEVSPATLTSDDATAEENEADGDEPETSGSVNEATDTSSRRSSEGSRDTSRLRASTQLTDEERYENEAWRMRLTVGSVFARDYIPKGYEKKETGEIIDFLSLKDPDEYPEYLDEPKQEVTKQAISSIFYPQYKNQRQSVLLKRGPVLLLGEERELMVFSNGFLLSRVDLGTLVNKLLDVDNGGGCEVLSEEVRIEMLRERFSQIDVDGTGVLDRYEVRDVFQSMGMALSDTTLDSLMNKFDSDSSGSIDLEEFKSMLNGINNPQEDSARRLRWGALVKKAKGRAQVLKKLDVAFQMSDIGRIEKIGECHDDDSDWARMSFALYLKNVDEPLVITCAKPGHVDPWMETFRTCISSIKSLDESVAAERYCSSRRIYGLRDVKKEPSLRRHRSSRDDWRGTTVDWGQEDGDF